MRVGNDYDVPPCKCTNCGKELNAAFGVIDDSTPDASDRPQPEDLTLCIVCGHLMIYTKDMVLRDLTDKEMKKAAGNPALVAASTALAQVKNAKS